MYQISFSVRCEFYSTGFYYLFSDKLSNQKPIIINDNDSTIIPLFTDVLTKSDVNLPLGWQLYAQPSCGLDDPNDTLCIESLLNDMINIISFIEN